MNGRTAGTSDTRASGAASANIVRPALDAIDRHLLRLLAEDARMPGNALAAAVGIAPSTCHTRVRRLVETGVIRGFHADIDPDAVGRPLRAMIAVGLRPDARGRIRELVGEIAELPGVLDVYFLAGADDYLLHVATADTEELRGIVETLNRRREVTGTKTSLVFEHVRAASPAE